LTDGEESCQELITIQDLTSQLFHYSHSLMPTLRTVTLGCKVNQYETEYLRQGLARVGYREPARDEPADLCVVNTCTVTGEADLKSRKLIRQLARRNPGARIIVMGCYATRAPETLASLPGVAEVITDKRQLPAFLARFGVDPVPDGIDGFGRHRAYIKIQDGCRMECSYCIIPQTRPVLVSRPPDEVLAEVRRLVDHGHREIVLTGIHLGHYGVDLDHPGRRVRLAELVARIAALEGDFRVRISSMEAAEVTRALLELMQAYPRRICPHLHLSMQSGSDAVLRRMRRRYSAERFVEQCCRVQEALDRPALTTDAIVGFPGETEADFEATCRVAERIGFSKIHVFRFSPREGTRAATFPDQISAPTRRRRGEELGQLARRLRQAYFESLAGRRLQVLVETPLDDRTGAFKERVSCSPPGQLESYLVGTSARYAPVVLPGGEERIGTFVEVIAEGIEGGADRRHAGRSGLALTRKRCPIPMISCFAAR